MAPITLPSLATTAIEDKNDQIKRLATLNDNYRKRYITYTKMVAVFVFLLVGIIVAKALEPIVPGFIITIVMVVLVLVFLYYEYFYYAELGSRSKLNYDELELTNDQSKSGQTNVVNDGGILDGTTVGYCIGDSCCNTPGFKYAPSQNKCVPDCSGNSLGMTTGGGSSKCWTGDACATADGSRSNCRDTFTNMVEVDFGNSRERRLDPSDISLMIAPKDLGTKPFDIRTDNISSF